MDSKLAQVARSLDTASPIESFVGKVHNRDCLDLMADMPTASVSMIFADPPFNLGKKYHSYKDNIPFKQYIHWTEKWLQECVRLLKDDGSLFLYNIPRLLVYSANMLNTVAEFRHWIAWNSNGQPLGKTLQPAHYGILFYTKNKNSKFYDVRAPHKTCRLCKHYLKDYGGKEHLRHPFGYQISDVWDDIHRVRHNCRRIEKHPCQLPVPLIERMILMTTDERDIIFDPFTGSGSAGVAAKQLGRRYIGSDIDKQYCQAARKAMRSAKEVTLGDAYVSVYLKRVFSVRDGDIATI